MQEKNTRFHLLILISQAEMMKLCIDKIRFYVIIKYGMNKRTSVRKNEAKAAHSLISL
jgi:hypothetical protein